MSDFELSISQNAASLSVAPEVYLRILRKAVAQTAQDLEEIEEAFRLHNRDAIEKISHRLKGDYDNLRIKAMASPAHQMNEIARGAGEWEELEALKSDLAQCFEKLKEKLQTLDGNQTEDP